MFVYNSENEFDGLHNTVIALGNFDGLHIGHMHLVDRVCNYAKEHGLKGGIMFFDRNPKSVLSNDADMLITPTSYRLEILNKTDIDFVYVQHFTKEFAKINYKEFVIQTVARFDPVHIVVGRDYRYGSGAEGNVYNLAELGKEYGFTVDVAQKVCLDGHEISSSIVREFIKQGDIKNVNRHLGRDYFITGEVVKGFNNGEKMGFPTININFDKNMIIPANGVYATEVEIDGTAYKSVTNIGTKPTYGKNDLTIETHIMNYSGVLYGKTMTVRFKQRIRDEIHFDSVSSLADQIAKDVDFAGKL